MAYAGSTPATTRRETLNRTRLYFVCEAHAAAAVEPALAGGVDVVQLRDRRAGEAELEAAGKLYRRLASEHGALFIVNDDPDLALALGADGIHVGQDDMPVAEVRARVGEDLLIGLSTHSPEQFDAGLESEADYLSAGPVHETPTKPGRPATGLDLIRHAAAAAGSTPWFAIGGLDADTAPAAVAAGAQRIVVVRAIRDSHEPRGAAERLRTIVEQGAGVGAS